MTGFKLLFMVAFGPTLICLFVFLRIREIVGEGLAIIFGVAAQVIVAACNYWALKWDSPSSRLRRMCGKQLAEYRRRYQPYKEDAQ